MNVEVTSKAVTAKKKVKQVPRLVGKPRPWTDAEKQILRKYYATGGVAECKRRGVNRPNGSITSMASKLGIPFVAFQSPTAVDSLKSPVKAAKKSVQPKRKKAKKAPVSTGDYEVDALRSLFPTLDAIVDTDSFQAAEKTIVRRLRKKNLVGDVGDGLIRLTLGGVAKLRMAKVDIPYGS